MRLLPQLLNLSPRFRKFQPHSTKALTVLTPQMNDLTLIALALKLKAVATRIDIDVLGLSRRQRLTTHRNTRLAATAPVARTQGKTTQTVRRNRQNNLRHRNLHRLRP